MKIADILDKMLWKAGGGKDNNTIDPAKFYQNTGLKIILPSAGSFAVGTIKSKLEIRDSHGKNT